MLTHREWYCFKNIGDYILSSNLNVQCLFKVIQKFHLCYQVIILWFTAAKCKPTVSSWYTQKVHKVNQILLLAKYFFSIVTTYHNVYKDTCKSQQSALITVYIKLCTGPGAFVFYVTHDIYTSFESQQRCSHSVELGNSKNAECIS